MQQPLPVLELPTDKLLLMAGRQGWGTVRRSCTPELTKRLVQWCKREEINLREGLLAGLFVWLQRLTDHERLVIRVQGRPVVLELGNIASVGKLLGEVKMQSRTDQDPPFEGEATLQVTLDTDGEALLGELNWRMTVQEGCLQINLLYDAALYYEETALRFLEQVGLVLEVLVADAGQLFREFDLLTEEEKALHAGLNGPLFPLPEYGTIVSLFEAAVQKHAHRTALSSDEARLTYQELNDRANQVANRLLELGVKHGDIVALLLERSVETVIGMLGILKAGAAYVPLDPEYPEERNRYVLEDCRATRIVTKTKHEQAVAALLQGRAGERMVVHVDEPMLGVSTADPNVKLRPDDLAYLIYTSGSTGRPKGTMLPHRGVVNLAHSTRLLYVITERDVLLEYASFSFDASVFDTWSALSWGARLHLLSQDERLSVDAFADAVEREQGTLLLASPAIFIKQLAAYLTNAHVEKLATLRRANSCAEQLSGETVRLWQSKFGTRVIIGNAYGPTECSVCVSHYDVPGALGAEVANVPIGRGLPNYELLILNRSMQRCPVNVPGELYVGGPVLADGYWEQPERTAQSFVPHPNVPGARLYRTGDLVRLLPNGEMEFVGRKDQQVKIRGFRIEIGEIEDVLHRWPTMQEVAVVVKESGGNKRLAAYYTASDGEEVDGAVLRDFLVERLPAFMVPDSFHHLAEIPLQPNRKIDRKTLSERVEERPMSQGFHAEPMTEAQRLIVEAWQQVLGVERAGVEDDFFTLGGSSLHVLQIMVVLKPRFPELKVQDFFRCRTVAALARELERGKATEVVSRPEQREPVVMHEDPAIKSDAFPQAKELLRPNAILLTGATGYLGAHVLYDLLNKSSSDVYCLVRGSDVLAAEARLEETMRFYFGEGIVQKMALRVTAIAGDLAAPGLGLSPEDRRLLEEETEVIIHCGADVRHYGVSEHFDRVNVLGTTQLLDLARQGREVRFHHVSTLAVLQEGRRDGVSGNVYVDSKREAERLVREAMAEGIPATIHRAGNLIGHSATGRFQRNIDSNAFYRMMKAMLMLEAVATSDSWVDLTPIDYASAALVELALRSDTAGRTFHLCNPQQMTFADFVQAVQSLGYRVTLMEPDQYRSRVFAQSTADVPEEILQSIILGMEEGSPSEAGVIFGCLETRRLLEAEGIRCPLPDRNLVCNMLKYAIEVGYLSKHGEHVMR